MNPKKTAVAGTLESSDVLVEIAPAPGGLTLRVESPVGAEFGEAIEASVRGVLRDCGVDAAEVTLRDRGALDCTIRARVETAVKRAAKA